MSNNKFQDNSFDIETPLDFQGDMTKKSHSGQKDSIAKKSSAVLFAVIVGALAVLFFRTFYLQVLQGAHYKDVAENNRIREVVINAPRGSIKDAYGQTLAYNIPSYDIVFIPAHLPKNDVEVEVLLKKLSGICSIDFNETKAIVAKENSENKNGFLLKNNIESELALEIIERSSELPGIYVGNTAKRSYADGIHFSHIIGYDGKVTKEELEKNPSYIMTDNIGKSGIEYSYEKYLHGIHGAKRFEVDSNNNIKEDLGVINPVPGDGLVLHVDAELQKQISLSLEKIIEQNEDATGAVAIAINPQNGGIRALVSQPSYDNNLFSGGIDGADYGRLVGDPKKPLLNRAIAGEYPPGSTFKPVIASIALEEDVISEHTSLNCPGAIHIGSWSFPDWKTHGHTDVKKAIAQSCDVFFYAVGGGWQNISGLGVQRINQYGKSFGFGTILGIDLPGESLGNLPDETWKFKKLGEKWYIGDSYHIAIGQGYMTATPLQLVSAIGSIANGGTLFRPQVVDKIVSSQGKQEQDIEPSIVNDLIVSEDNIRIVKEGMRQTVAGDGGSGRLLGTLEVASAGKTGTSQFGNEDKTHAWYVSFAPYENPEIAMIVLIESGGEGHDWAVPATKEIFQWYFDWNRGENMPEEGNEDDPENDEPESEKEELLIEE